MASAVFQVKDTKEARTELSLLLQIEPSKLSKISNNGYLTVEFDGLAEDTALQVLSRAVSNHGFQISIVSQIEAVTKLEPKTQPVAKTKAGK